MPIRRGSVSFARFRLGGKPPRDLRRWLTRALKAGAFQPLDPKGDEERSAGFVELEAPDRADFAPGDLFPGPSAVFAWRVDRLAPPGGQLRAELARWSQAFEAKEGRRPGRREKAEQKQALKRAWRSRAEPATRVFDLSLDPEAGELKVWATSAKVVEEVQAALERHLELSLVRRTPAASVPPARLDALAPTPALFGEEAR